MPRECYEDRDDYGQPICGYHVEPLTPRRIPSPTQNQPMVELVCPESGHPLRVIPSDGELI